MPSLRAKFATLGRLGGGDRGRLRGNSVGTPLRSCRATAPAFATLLYLTGKKMVGAAGFEPTTPSPPGVK